MEETEEPHGEVRQPRYMQHHHVPTNTAQVTGGVGVPNAMFATDVEVVEDMRINHSGCICLLSLTGAESAGVQSRGGTQGDSRERDGEDEA